VGLCHSLGLDLPHARLVLISQFFRVSTLLKLCLANQLLLKLTNYHIYLSLPDLSHLVFELFRLLHQLFLFSRQLARFKLNPAIVAIAIDCMRPHILFELVIIEFVTIAITTIVVVIIKLVIIIVLIVLDSIIRRCQYNFFIIVLRLLSQC